MRRSECLRKEAFRGPRSDIISLIPILDYLGDTSNAFNHTQ